MMKIFFSIIFCISISSCALAPKKHLYNYPARLEGTWVVDVDATLFEHKMELVPHMSERMIKEENLEKDRYEFTAEKLTIYRSFIPDGDKRDYVVYEEDNSSIIILVSPPEWTEKKYSTKRPPLKELIRLSGSRAFAGIEYLIGFEFTGNNQVRLFHVRIDAKGNRLNQFTGIHLIRKTD